MVLHFITNCFCTQNTTISFGSIKCLFLNIALIFPKIASCMAVLVLQYYSKCNCADPKVLYTIFYHKNGVCKMCTNSHQNLYNYGIQCKVSIYSAKYKTPEHVWLTTESSHWLAVKVLVLNGTPRLFITLRIRRTHFKPIFGLICCFHTVTMSS